MSDRLGHGCFAQLGRRPPCTPGSNIILSMKSFDDMGVLTALLYLYLLSVNHLHYYTTETNKAFFLAH